MSMGSTSSAALAMSASSALAVTPSGHFLLTGGLRGVVSLHWLHSLEVLRASHCQFVPSRLLPGMVSALKCHAKGYVTLKRMYESCEYTS